MGPTALQNCSESLQLHEGQERWINLQCAGSRCFISSRQTPTNPTDPTEVGGMKGFVLLGPALCTVYGNLQARSWKTIFPS